MLSPSPLSHLKKCCVSGCENRHSKRHRFPKNDPETYKIWLSLINPKNHKTLTVKQIYNRYYVCDDHFDPGCKVPNTKRGLIRAAIPTINISGCKDVKEEILSCKRTPTLDNSHVTDLDNSTSTENKQHHQTFIDYPVDQKPVISNFEQRIRIKPFAKTSFTSETPDAGKTLMDILASAPELKEPEIKIEHNNITSEADPLLLTYSDKSKFLLKPEIEQNPEKVTIKKIRGQSKVKKLSATITKIKIPSTTILKKRADSLLALFHATNTSKSQVCDKINAATSTLNVLPTLVSKKIKAEVVDLTWDDDKEEFTT